MRLSPLLIASALAPLALTTLAGCGSDDDSSADGPSTSVTTATGGATDSADPAPPTDGAGDGTDGTDGSDDGSDGSGGTPTAAGACPVTLDQVKDAMDDPSQVQVLRVNEAGSITGSCTFVGETGGMAVSWIYSYAENLGSDLTVACTDEPVETSVPGADDAFTCSGSISPLGIAVFGDDMVQLQPTLDEGDGHDELVALMPSLLAPPPAGS